jgi:Zn-dependent peptidase ImmA (M78 family)
VSNAEEQDREANAFAMALLMPEDWLLDDIDELGGIDVESDEKIKRLAKRYHVSEQMMTLRIGQLLAQQRRKSFRAVK